jgi:ribosomal-protein-alanine N-acetyltransferase
MQNKAKTMKTLNRVILRPLQSGDCDEFILAVRRSQKLHGLWVQPKATTKDEFSKYQARLSSDRHCGFLVIHRTTKEFVGVININEVIRGAFQSGSLGYYAFEPHAGKGLMREGLTLVIKHAFGKLKLHRLEANIQPGNHASIAIVKNCGFVCEGLGRRLLKVRGRWQDHERWALLASQ